MPVIRQEDSGFAEVNGARLYYQVRGTGPALLLVHAGVADSRMWAAQVDVFARDFKTISYDMRGYGRTGVPPGPFASHEDLAGVLDFLGIDRAHLVGASFGGSVAIDFALVYPDRVTALVLCDTALGGYEMTSAEMQRFFAEEEAALERDDLAAATELNLRTWVDGPQRTPDQVDPGLRERVRAMQYHAFALPVPRDAERRPLGPPALERLGEIHAPTLVIAGDGDVAEFLHIARVVAAGIPGARQATISGAAHLPSMERPEVFNGLVLDFLGKLA